MEERGKVLKYDVSLPMPVFYDIVDDMRHRWGTTHPPGMILRPSLIIRLYVDPVL